MRSCRRFRTFTSGLGPLHRLLHPSSHSLLRGSYMISPFRCTTGVTTVRASDSRFRYDAFFFSLVGGKNNRNQVRRHTYAMGESRMTVVWHICGHFSLEWAHSVPCRRDDAQPTEWLVLSWPHRKVEARHEKTYSDNLRRFLCLTRIIEITV